MMPIGSRPSKITNTISCNTKDSQMLKRIWWTRLSDHHRMFPCLKWYLMWPVSNFNGTGSDLTQRLSADATDRRHLTQISFILAWTTSLLWIRLALNYGKKLKKLQELASLCCSNRFSTRLGIFLVGHQVRLRNMTQSEPKWCITWDYKT